MYLKQLGTSKVKESWLFEYNQLGPC